MAALCRTGSSGLITKRGLSSLSSRLMIGCSLPPLVRNRVQRESSLVRTCIETSSPTQATSISLMGTSPSGILLFRAAPALTDSWVSWIGNRPVGILNTGSTASCCLGWNTIMNGAVLGGLTRSWNHMKMSGLLFQSTACGEIHKHGSVGVVLIFFERLYKQFHEHCRGNPVRSSRLYIPGLREGFCSYRTGSLSFLGKVHTINGRRRRLCSPQGLYADAFCTKA